MKDVRTRGTGRLIGYIDYSKHLPTPIFIQIPSHNQGLTYYQICYIKRHMKILIDSNRKGVKE